MSALRSAQANGRKRSERFEVYAKHDPMINVAKKKKKNYYFA